MERNLVFQCTSLICCSFLVKCEVGAQSLKLGESAQITAPKKEADVVFVVEQLAENEEVYKNLITPLVSSLTNDFKKKGIT